jgi:hypothetical protein
VRGRCVQTSAAVGGRSLDFASRCSSSVRRPWPSAIAAVHLADQALEDPELAVGELRRLPAAPLLLLLLGLVRGVRLQPGPPRHSIEDGGDGTQPRGVIRLAVALGGERALQWSEPARRRSPLPRGGRRRLADGADDRRGLLPVQLVPGSRSGPRRARRGRALGSSRRRAAPPPGSGAQPSSVPCSGGASRRATIDPFPRACIRSCARARASDSRRRCE